MKLHKIGVYGVNVGFAKEFKEVKRYLIKEGLWEGVRDEIEHFEDSTGGVSITIPDEHIYIMLCVNTSLDVVCHEAIHCAIEILSNLGITVGPEEQEPLCYLADHLFTEYCKWSGAEGFSTDN